MHTVVWNTQRSGEETGDVDLKWSVTLFVWVLFVSHTPVTVSFVSVTAENCYNSNDIIVEWTCNERIVKTEAFRSRSNSHWSDY